MSDQRQPLFDRTVRLIIIGVILAGMILPSTLWAAKKYMGWEPPKLINDVLNKLPF